METKKTKSKTEKKTEGKTHPLIIGPRITEKSALFADKGVYTFNVKSQANKNEIKKAIKHIYGVEPIKISVTQITEKVILRNGIFGKKQGGKKAVVHLKKGDKITFV